MPTIIKRLWIFDYANGKRGVIFAKDHEEACHSVAERQFTNGSALFSTLRQATFEEEAEIASELQSQFLRG